MVHVSFTPDRDDPFPIVLPMIGQMGSFADHHHHPASSSAELLARPLDLYLHGSISSRIMKLSRDAVGRGEDGLGVCVAATKVDGYVLALTPFHHSYNFRSAVLHGHAQVVEDPDEKLFALELITNKVVPRRSQNTRTPPNKVEMQSTHVLRVRVSAGGAKLRWGVPNGDRGDLKSEEVLSKYWAGVIPMWETFGDPVPAPHNRAAVPEHVTGFIDRANKKNRETAFEAAKEQED